MARQVSARFLVDHPIGAGAVRAILDTLTAQGGAYEPQLVHRPPDHSLRRITWARPAGLLEEVREGGNSTTFLRMAERGAYPMLSFDISERPRTDPTSVVLKVPEDALTTSDEIEQLMGISKGLYIFLESPWGTVGISDAPVSGPLGAAPAPPRLDWANFLGPQAVAHLGPSRLLTSMAYIVEILPDGGMMLVTHPTPHLAASEEGVVLRHRIAEAIGLNDTHDPHVVGGVFEIGSRHRANPRFRRASHSDTDQS